MELVKPSIQYASGYLDAHKEYQALGERLDIDYEERKNNMQAHIDSLEDASKGIGLAEELAPYTRYWAIVDGEFVGTVSIRHYLNEHLEKIGGHVGYDVRPSKRKKGYGSEMLKLALPIIQEMGITKALVTCDSTNIASRKIIEKNGGIFQDEIEQDEGKPTKLRFWIDLGNNK